MVPRIDEKKLDTWIYTRVCAQRTYLGDDGEACLLYCEHEARAEAEYGLGGACGCLLHVDFLEVVPAAKHLAVMPDDDDFDSCVHLCMCVRI